MGIDIGGTDTKFCLFENSKLSSVGENELGKISTFPHKTGKIETKKFFTRIIEEISCWFRNYNETWPKIQGIGISWPGAIFNSRIAGISKTLSRITYHGKMFGKNASPDELHSFPFCDEFWKALHQFCTNRGINLQPNFTIILENDGNAEAYGNYCIRICNDANSPSGKVIVKLGTSLAGGRIKNGQAVTDDIAEFAKIALNLNTQPNQEWPQGLTRDYVSSISVRNLSRYHKFNGKAIFGLKNQENTEDQERFRIESAELGQFLPIWKKNNNTTKNFLNDLVDYDNFQAPQSYSEQLNSMK